MTLYDDISQSIGHKPLMWIDRIDEGKIDTKWENHHPGLAEQFQASRATSRRLSVQALLQSQLNYRVQR